MTEYLVKYITFDQIDAYRAEGWEIKEYRPYSYPWQFGVMAKKMIGEGHGG